MSTKCEFINGVQLGVDGFLHMPFSPGRQGREAYGYFDHFVTVPLVSDTSVCGFTTTELTDGTVIQCNGSGYAGGWLGLKGGADGQGIQIQGAECFLPAANKHIYYEIKLKAQDADDIDWMVGLASIDTDVFSTDPTELIVFRGADGSANINVQVRNGGTGDAADTGDDLANNTAVRLGFLVNGVTSVTPYINGVAETAITANIPTGELALTLGMLNGGTTANQVLAIDYLAACQLV